MQELADGRWTVVSSDADILAVTEEGRVRALAEGVAKVLVQRGSAKDSATIVVRAPAAPATSWMSVSVGDETVCAVAADRRAFCWGGDYYGAVGDGALRRWTAAHAPVAVGGGASFASVTVGRFHACGLTAEGRAMCWGDGKVLDGADASDPVLQPRVEGASVRFTALTAGDYHVCGIDLAGAAYCWGLGAFGELGDGVSGSHRRGTPTAVATSLRFSQVLAGHHRTCGVTRENTAYCWGLASMGRLGTGSDVNQAAPAAVAGGLPFTSVSGRSHMCGTTPAGEVHCWGPDMLNQIGSGSSFLSRPFPLAPQKQALAVTAGTTTTCGVGAGSTYCWGSDENGLLGSAGAAAEVCAGVDRIPCSASPLPVAGGMRFVQVSMSANSACGITEKGELFCWGSNEKGQLGNGSPAAYSTAPVRVADPV